MIDNKKITTLAHQIKMEYIMKKLFLLSIFFVFILGSCKNESVDLENGTTSANVYLPMAAGNFWTYKVKDAAGSERDSLYIQKDTTVAGNVCKKLRTKTFPFGFYSIGLNRNWIRKSEDKILVSGKTSLDFIPNVAFNLELIDFAVFKEVTNANEEIDVKLGVIEQTVSGFPVKVEYTLRSVGLAPLSAFTTSEGKTYADVKPIKLTINAKITATTTIAGFPLAVPILNAQDVVTATQYFAKNKGMVYAKTVVSYQLQPLPTGVNLGIPTSGNEIQEEFLDTFLIN